MKTRNLGAGLLLAIALSYSGDVFAGDGGGDGQRERQIIIRDIIGWGPDDWRKFKEWKKRRISRLESEASRRDSATNSFTSAVQAMGSLGSP